MSFRAWVFAVAIGLAAIFFVVFGAKFSWDSFSRYQQDHARQRAEAAAYEANAASQSPEACRAIMSDDGFVGWLTCVVESVTSDGSAKQSEYDLKAQQDMAAWAYGMLVVTMWLTFITLLGVVFVWRTWIEAKKTTEQAKREADIAEQSFWTLEKPYIAVKITETHMLHNNQGKQRGICYTVLNAGRSPAILTAIRHHLGKTVKKGEWESCYEVIQSGGELNNQRHVTLSANESAIVTESDRIVFFVQIAYMDATGVGAETVWRFIKDGTKPFVLLNIA